MRGKKKGKGGKRVGGKYVGGPAKGVFPLILNASLESPLKGKKKKKEGRVKTPNFRGKGKTNGPLFFYYKREGRGEKKKKEERCFNRQGEKKGENADAPRNYVDA